MHPTHSPQPRDLGIPREMFLLIPNLVKLEETEEGAHPPILNHVPMKWGDPRHSTDNGNIKFLVVFSLSFVFYHFS